MKKLLTQKLYEKFTMLQRNIDKMEIMLAKSATGFTYILVLVENDIITPIARILPEDEIQSLDVDNSFSLLFKELFEVASIKDTRQDISDFDTDSGELSNLFQSFNEALMDDFNIPH